MAKWEKLKLLLFPPKCVLCGKLLGKEETDLCHIGCGFSPDLSAHDTIRAIPIKGTEESISFGYISRKRDGLSEDGKRFVKHIKKCLAEKAASC